MRINCVPTSATLAPYDSSAEILAKQIVAAPAGQVRVTVSAAATQLCAARALRAALLVQPVTAVSGTPATVWVLAVTDGSTPTAGDVVAKGFRLQAATSPNFTDGGVLEFARSAHLALEYYALWAVTDAGSAGVTVGDF